MLFIKLLLFIRFFVLVIACLSLSDAWADSADEVYSRFSSSIFQIRIIEEKSGSQSALGSGFLIDEGNYIATNYHVVSSKVLKPEKYRIEIDIKDQSLQLDVVHVDVVSDLALLKLSAKVIDAPSFILMTEAPEKGERVFSLGNPHDIGMTVIEGNYNGFVENKFLPQIHFSGAINSGMSGGPAVNSRAEVIGVNVASAGNQIGFLVPVEKLHALLSELKELNKDTSKPLDLTSVMTKQIDTATSAMVSQALAIPWPGAQIGKANAAGKITAWFECWGNSNKDKKTNLQEISRGCNNGSSIFVGSKFRTGYIEYEFYYAEAQQWSSTQFYKHMAQETAHAMPGNRASKDHVGNFECVDKQVSTPLGLEHRVSYCTRPYKEFKGLFDVFYLAVSNDQNKYSVMSHFTLAGINKVSAQTFLARFMEVVSWQ